MQFQFLYQLVVHVLAGIVQPLDVSINAPCKTKVDAAATPSYDNHYLNGKFTAGERQILLTKSIGQAWEELIQDKDTCDHSRNAISIAIVMA